MHAQPSAPPCATQLRRSGAARAHAVRLRCCPPAAAPAPARTLRRCRARDPDAESFRPDGEDEDAARPARTQFVPHSAFDPPKSVEAKAAESVKALLTFAAVRLVVEQLDVAAADALRAALPIGPDGSAWLARLLRSASHADRAAALRVLQVRAAFAARDFDWTLLKDTALAELEAESVDMRRSYLQAALDAPAVGDDGDGAAEPS
jgi:hypothetical protein